jgi:hypothetical protein
MTRQDGAMLGYDPTGRSYAANRTPRGKTDEMGHAMRRPCHHYPVPCPSFYIGVRLPWGHLSGPGSECNCPSLDYKRPDRRQK